MGNGAERVVVLDLETTLDREATVFAPPGGSDITRWCLHRIAAASVLSAERTSDGSWIGFDLRSWSRPESSEEGILENLANALGPVERGEAVLLTYSGRRHDVEVLRRRAAHHLRMDLTPLAALRGFDCDRHRDLFEIVRGGSADRAPSLGDVCAGLGIDTDHTRTVQGRPVPPGPVRKSQVDVVATFIVDLYEQALHAGDAQRVLRGWDAVASYLYHGRRTWPHLAQFWRHPLVSGQQGQTDP